jgi:hypothetical protein
MQPRVRTAALPLPHSTFGPMRFLDALPWLVLAAAMRVIAFGGGPVALPAVFVASVAVLQAFISVTRRSIEIAGGETGLDGLTLREEFQLSLKILWQVALLMLVASVPMSHLMANPIAAHMMGGLDGMAFDQVNMIGKPWSAIIAALVLLMIVGAERRGGKADLREAAQELLARWKWLGAAIVALTLAYFALSFGQGLVRNAIWMFWQTSGASQFVKNLVYFVFIFGFAMLRLWVTLLIVTWGLKQSYLRADPSVSSRT